MRVWPGWPRLSGSIPSRTTSRRTAGRTAATCPFGDRSAPRSSPGSPLGKDGRPHLAGEPVDSFGQSGAADLQRDDEAVAAGLDVLEEPGRDPVGRAGDAVPATFVASVLVGRVGEAHPDPMHDGRVGSVIP